MRILEERCSIFKSHYWGRRSKTRPGKVKRSEGISTPTKIKNIRQFLVLTRYYFRFIPGFSKIAKPPIDLLKKKKTIFKWDGSIKKAFTALRDTLCEEPVLQYLVFSNEFNVTTDASGYAIEAVLSQGPKDLPIAYCSRLLNTAEKKYSAMERELLAIVNALHYFRPYLQGREFTLVTVYRPLEIKIA